MTQDEIKEMAKKVYGDTNWTEASLSRLEELAALVAAKEREACAKVVDDIESRCIAEDVDDPPLKHVAAAIRARGEQA